MLFALFWVYYQFLNIVIGSSAIVISTVLGLIESLNIISLLPFKECGCLNITIAKEQTMYLNYKVIIIGIFYFINYYKISI